MPFYIVWLPILLGVLVAGCTPERVPRPTTSDYTGPALRWRYENLSTNDDPEVIHVSPGDWVRVMNAEPDEALRIWLHAFDPGGVQTISLSGRYEIYCGTSGQTPPKVIWLPKQEVTRKPDSKNMVSTSAFLLLNTTPPTQCDAPRSEHVFTRVRLVGFGRDYTNGDSNAELLIEVY